MRNGLLCKRSLVRVGGFRLLCAFGLLISVAPFSRQTTSPPPIEALIYGDMITHTFTPAVTAFQFAFDAVRSDSVTLTAVGNSDSGGPIIDPALTMFDPSGQLVAQNDDALDPVFGLTNARIADYPIPVSGRYSVTVTRNRQATPSDGAFTLTIKGKLIDQSRGTITYSQPAQGVVSATLPAIRYPFHAQRGDVLLAQVKGSALDSNGSLSPMLTLLRSDGTALVSVSAVRATITMLALPAMLIPQDDVYTLVVSRSAVDKRTTAAGFNLSLSRDRSGLALSYGDQASGTINAAFPETVYRFQGKTGDTITVTMITADSALTARLTIRTESDKPLISAQNGGKTLKATDAQISSYRLSADGVYVIAAGRSGGVSGTSAGAYTVQLTLVKAGQP